METRNVTNNQSTADYGREKLLIFDNKFSDDTVKNTTGADKTIPRGTILVREGGYVKPMQDHDTLVVGVLTDDLLLANNEAKEMKICVSGSVVASSLKVFDGTNFIDADLSAIVSISDGDVLLKDILNGLGINPELSTENTKFDN